MEMPSINPSIFTSLTFFEFSMVCAYFSADQSSHNPLPLFRVALSSLVAFVHSSWSELAAARVGDRVYRPALLNGGDARGGVADDTHFQLFVKDESFPLDFAMSRRDESVGGSSTALSGALLTLLFRVNGIFCQSLLSIDSVQQTLFLGTEWIGSESTLKLSDSYYEKLVGLCELKNGYKTLLEHNKGGLVDFVSERLVLEVAKLVDNYLQEVLAGFLPGAEGSGGIGGAHRRAVHKLKQVASDLLVVETITAGLSARSRFCQPQPLLSALQSKIQTVKDLLRERSLHAAPAALQAVAPPTRHLHNLISLFLWQRVASGSGSDGSSTLATTPPPQSFTEARNGREDLIRDVFASTDCPRFGILPLPFKTRLA